MQKYRVTDREFSEYGKVIDADFSVLLDTLKQKECPQNGTVYVPSDMDLERVSAYELLQNEYFGGLPIQIGYCNGNNDTLNCLEYHKSSEINITDNDIVLLLGREQDINEGKFDTENVVAFAVPAGMAVEIYGTTLHYAPCGKDYRVAIVLPKGTNCDKPNSVKGKMLWGVNKWLLAHKSSPEAKQGAYVGLVGDNITIK